MKLLESGRASYRHLPGITVVALRCKYQNWQLDLSLAALIPCFSLVTIYIQTTDKLRRRGFMRVCSFIHKGCLVALILWFTGCAAGSSAPDYSAAVKNPDRPPAEVELDATRKPE